MSVIVNIRHEVDLSEYTSTQVDSGDLSADAAAALAGSAKGLKVVVDDTNVLYGRKSISLSGKTSTSFRIYYSPNSMTQDATSSDIAAIQLTSLPWKLFEVIANYSSGNYRISAYTYNDAGDFSSTGNHVITNASHYIEVQVVRATNDSSADGTLKLYIDGSLEHTLTGIDNYHSFVLAEYMYAGIGVIQGVPAGWSGTFFLDEIVMNDDGAYIGPVAAATGVPKHMMYYERLRGAV